MTKENWKPGKTGDCIVSDQGEETSAGESEYYGGFLVCESIRRKEDKKLILAAPGMLEALQNIHDYWNYPQAGNLSLNDHVVKIISIAEEALKKATE